MLSFRLLLTVPILLRDMHTKALDLLLAVLPAYIACTVMAATVWLIGTQTADADPWVRLGFKIGAGGVAYIGYLILFHRNWSITALRMLRPDGRPAASSETVTATA